MCDDPPAAPAPIDPIAMARRDLKKALPRRFWREVAVVPREGGFGLDLDGKPVRTPAKALLVVPSHDLAEAVAAEWRATGEVIDPDAMPLTRLVNTAIDGVAKAMPETVAEVAKFAETDLVCYRAADPESLVAAQTKAWDPILAFAREVLDARFICAEGVMYAEQPQDARDAIRRAVETIAAGPAGPLRLAALSLMTSLTGSALLSLAVAHGALSAEEAWSAAHIDEDHQMQTWGADSEAQARRAHRWSDMQAAARTLALVSASA